MKIKRTIFENPKLKGVIPESIGKLVKLEKL